MKIGQFYWEIQKMKKNLLIILCLLLLSFGCSKTIPGEPPIKELEISKSEIIVWLLPKTPIQSVKKMSLLGRLEPGVSQSEAEEIFGPPDQFVVEKKSLSYAEYILPLGRIRVYENFFQTEYEAGYANWLLVYPNNISVDNYLIKQITKHIDVASRRTKIIYIMNFSKDEFLTIYLDGNQITKIAWTQRP